MVALEIFCLHLLIESSKYRHKNQINTFHVVLMVIAFHQVMQKISGFFQFFPIC